MTNKANQELAERIAVALERLADVADAVAMGFWNYDPSRSPHGEPIKDRALHTLQEQPNGK